MDGEAFKEFLKATRELRNKAWKELMEEYGVEQTGPDDTVREDDTSEQSDSSEGVHGRQEGLEGLALSDDTDAE